MLSVSKPLNHFHYGPNDIELDLFGYTIAQAVEALADVMNYDPLTVAAYVNRRRVWDWEKFVLGPGAVVEFLKEWGIKGSGREDEMTELLRSIDCRLAEIGRRLESVEHFIAKPQLAEMLTRGEYTVNEVARLTVPYGIKKAKPYTVRLACADGRIPEAKKNESGHYIIPRQAVLRILQEGVPPERR